MPVTNTLKIHSSCMVKKREEEVSILF